MSLLIKSLIPDDSSWKIAIVLPDDNNLNTFSSSKDIEFISNLSEPFLPSLIDLIALSITVRVLNPRKSNLTNPIFSTSSLSYWVIIDSD